MQICNNLNKEGNVIHCIKYQLSTKRDGKLIRHLSKQKQDKNIEAEGPLMKLVVFRTIHLFSNNIFPLFYVY